ncbi:tetratricopeptide repeat protein [Microbulbifer sp. ZKSA006]|uniref:tetratricopeptide repeat protein n=1 Tax=Microbulbifer sp. ZKSA006 TaxID=3243390 RepID=UPI00403950B0
MIKLLSYFFTVFSASTALGLETYIYPPTIDININCSIDSKIIDDIETYYSDTDLRHSGSASAQAVDLNGDGACEILLTPPPAHVDRGHEFTIVLMANKNSYQPAGEISWGTNSWRYGKFKNGYPRILVATYTGHRTNPIYVTDVYSFDGKTYVKEFDSQYSHGQFMDLGLKAYQNKNYKLAERWYLNAYRMHREENLSDANNLALVYIRQNRCTEAVDLLTKHLDLPNNTKRQIKSAEFNIGLCQKTNK